MKSKAHATLALPSALLFGACWAGCGAAPTPTKTPSPPDGPDQATSAEIGSPAVPLPTANLAGGLTFISQRQDQWMKEPPKIGNNFGCASTCHTALSWAVAPKVADPGQTATNLFQQIDSRAASVDDWHLALPYYGTATSDDGKRSLGTEAILNAVLMKRMDAECKRQPTERAVSRMWQVQRADGGFDWMSYQLAPWENGDEFLGASLAAQVTVPPWFNQRERERAALAAFLREKKGGATGFATAIALWSTSESVGHLPGVWTDEERKSALMRLATSQSEGGGFTWAALGAKSISPGDDPMPTAAVLLAWCTSELEPASPLRDNIRRGVTWLAGQQAKDGSFPARSPNAAEAENDKLATDAATGFSLAAISTCADAFKTPTAPAP